MLFPNLRHFEIIKNDSFFEIVENVKFDILKIAYLGQYEVNTRELLYTHSLGYNERFQKQKYIESAPPPKWVTSFFVVYLDSDRLITKNF